MSFNVNFKKIFTSNPYTSIWFDMLKKFLWYLTVYQILPESWHCYYFVTHDLIPMSASKNCDKALLYIMKPYPILSMYNVQWCISGCVHDLLKELWTHPGAYHTRPSCKSLDCVTCSKFQFCKVKRQMGANLIGL